MRYLILAIATLSLLFMAAIASLIDGCAWIARRLSVCALLLLPLCAAAQTPTLADPIGLNQLEYTGTTDTLWGFVLVLTAFDPATYSDTIEVKRGGVVYGVQPFPAYCLRWKGNGHTPRSPEFYHLNGTLIKPETVFLFKVRNTEE